MASIPPAESYDVIIVGAGISGINAAYRIQSELPGYTYTILEARDSLGGTWDLFKYPGIRSDSDLHTFGFSWRPWDEANAIAEGPKIKSYVAECAAAYGIDKRIQYRNRIQSANWSSKLQRWTLQALSDGQTKAFTSRFVMFGTGYYNYETPLEAQIPGLEKFKGQTIHPQFWPEKIDYKGKKIAVIGSGATAVTLIPNLVKEGAEKVTMLQRSPGYIIALPQKDPLANFFRRWFPKSAADTLIRLKFLLLPFLFFKFCKAFPKVAKKVLQKETLKQVPDMPVEHFNPSYNPWDQRLCLCPDGDFFEGLRSGHADIVTDHIEAVTENGIMTKKGKFIDADIIVTATGLKLQLLGGAKLTVDGVPINPSEKYVWKGMMLQDVPNAAMILGYTNASWTLGADATARAICRLLKKMDNNRQNVVVPRVQPGSTLKPQNVLNLNSTYIVKAKGVLPMAGDQAPFLPRENYLTDYPFAVYGNLSKGLEYQ